MAAEKSHVIGERAKIVHLLTPAATLESLREPTAGVDLMDRHNLNRYEGETLRTLRRGISHFLSPQLRVLIKEKPRIALSEKAEFSELLSEEPSGRPIQELSIDLLRRSFMIRKRVVNGTAAAQDDDASGMGRPPVRPDVPAQEQTTNKFSPAFAKKQAKRARPPDDEEEAPTPAPDVKLIMKPLVSKLMAMKWPGWGNPFSIVLKKSNAPPRYFEYIKRPMNLTFVRDNLNKNKYSSVAEVAADLELIVSNALKFNPTSDPVHHFALDLRAAFSSELSRIKSTLEEAQRGGEGGQIDKRQRVR